LSEFPVEVSESVLQDFAVTRTLGSFELLPYMLAGQQQTLSVARSSDLGRTQRRPNRSPGRSCFSLLLLD
jgi:hypothetical protein